jgi:uncharacterized membrane protein YhaH (DUF805 family)/DnaJ-domain-containing protein 1
MLQILATFAVLVVCLLLLLLLAIPSRLQSFLNWLKALFNGSTASVAAKDALGLALPWSGRLCRGALFLCFVGYFAALAFLVIYFGWRDEVALLADKLVESSQSLGEEWMFLPSSAANVLWFGNAHARCAVILLLLLLYFPLVFATKRVRDTNKSAWWLLITLVPYVGGIALLVVLGFLFFWPGTPGSNDYGRSPQDVYRRKPAAKRPSRGQQTADDQAEQGTPSPFMKAVQREFRGSILRQTLQPHPHDYLLTILPLVANVAISGGAVSRNTKIAVERLIGSRCADPEAAARLLAVFTAAATAPPDVESNLLRCRRSFPKRDYKASDLQDQLFEVAMADSTMNPVAEHILDETSKAFGRQCPRLAKYRRERASKASKPAPPSEEDHAKALGLKGPITPETVDQAYRVSVQQYHPDKVSTMGELIRQTAEDQMKKINMARDYFRKKLGK